MANVKRYLGAVGRPLSEDAQKMLQSLEMYQKVTEKKKEQKMGNKIEGEWEGEEEGEGERKGTKFALYYNTQYWYRYLT